jgi:pyruvate/2-oxoglutarate dehydrogenase complex dihydrolipoamide acyltransferase (E2) component
MAASFNGNLIVPVIKNADQLNLVGMAKAVNDLGGRAKAGKLRPNTHWTNVGDVWHLCQLSHGH